MGEFALLVMGRGGQGFPWRNVLVRLIAISVFFVKWVKSEDEVVGDCKSEPLLVVREVGSGFWVMVLGYKGVLAHGPCIKSLWVLSLGLSFWFVTQAIEDARPKKKKKIMTDD